MLDNLCEYVAPRPQASEIDPDLVDDVTGDCMPENLFDGISRLIVRLKERPLPDVPTQKSSPLLPPGNLSGESEDSEDDRSAVRYAYNQSPEADVSGTPQPLPRPPASELSDKITSGSPCDEKSFPNYEKLCFFTIKQYVRISVVCDATFAVYQKPSNDGEDTQFIVLSTSVEQGYRFDKYIK